MGTSPAGRAQPARTAVIGVAILVFVICSVVPVAYPVFTSLGASQAYKTVLIDARQRGLLYNTALLGVGTAVLAAAIGVPLGISLARVSLRGKALIIVRAFHGQSLLICTTAMFSQGRATVSEVNGA